MAKQAVPVEVQEALLDFQRYLSDDVAPMMVTDSIELLLKCPPQLVAQEIHGWVGAQYRGVAAESPVSDCLFHAVKKIHLMSEFNLIAADALDRYLAQLGQLVLAVCPEADRELLQQNLSNLGQVESATASSVEFLHRQAGSAGGAAGAATGGGVQPAATAAARSTAAAPAAPANAAAIGAVMGHLGSEVDIARGMQRLSVLLERLGQAATPGRGGGGPDAGKQALAMAAVNANSGAEFGEYMRRLAEAGVKADTGDVFRSLGDSLPGWSFEATGGDTALPGNRSVEAMRRLITEATDPEEGAKRFTEMMQAAIEQLNRGRLVQAVTMFGLADEIVSERKLNVQVVQSIRQRGHETISQEQLLQFAEDPEKHGLLTDVLKFFPVYEPRNLLDDLHGEPKRERRKMLLALLEAQGERTRAVVLERLAACVTGDVDDPHGYLHRNLVYLLRRIPRTEEAETNEAELIVSSSTLDYPWLVVREAIGALGYTRSSRADAALRQRLKEIEEALLKGQAPFSGEQMFQLLDRTIAALTRLGTKNALRTVVTHGFKRQSKLGDTMARLEELAARDLSADPELVEHMVKTLRGELPSKVLGFVVHKNNPNIGHLVRALAGTPSPSVRQLFDEIVQRFPEREFVEDVKRALAGFGAKAKPEEPHDAGSLTGDVELFGLPNLLQSLSDSHVSGALSLTGRDGDPIGTITMKEGKIAGCNAGPLNGEAAFYQLFERPIPGSFVFKKKRDVPAPPGGQVMEVMGAILEALRRHDEFQQARALVPDDARLEATGTKPTPIDDEDDVEFMRSVWTRATAGESPEACETAVRSDAYRVRRLYAHWLECGALKPAA